MGRHLLTLNSDMQERFGAFSAGSLRPIELLAQLLGIAEELG